MCGTGAAPSAPSCPAPGRGSGVGLPCPDTLWGIPVEAHREPLTFAVPGQWSEHTVSISVSKLRRSRE